MDRHYVSQDMLSLLNNQDYPLTINIIGAGGTGSNVVMSLAKICLALHALGRALLSVRVYDGDIITEANIGRQMFFKHDIGRRKSDVLVERINRSYGFSWLSKGNYPEELDSAANITISCVDTIKSRKAIIKTLKENLKRNNHTWITPYYLIDSGNGLDYGQVIISTVQDIPQPKSKYVTYKSLPDIFSLYKTIKEDNTTPSCSLREALYKQDIMINSFMADISCQILWQMLTKNYIEKFQYYINLSKMKLT